MVGSDWGWGLEMVSVHSGVGTLAKRGCFLELDSGTEGGRA